MTISPWISIEETKIALISKDPSSQTTKAIIVKVMDIISIIITKRTKETSAPVTNMALPRTTAPDPEMVTALTTSIEIRMPGDTMVTGSRALAVQKAILTRGSKGQSTGAIGGIPGSRSEKTQITANLGENDMFNRWVIGHSLKKIEGIGISEPIQRHTSDTKDNSMNVIATTMRTSSLEDRNSATRTGRSQRSHRNP